MADAPMPGRSEFSADEEQQMRQASAARLRGMAPRPESPVWGKIGRRQAGEATAISDAVPRRNE